VTPAVASRARRVGAGGPWQPARLVLTDPLCVGGDHDLGVQAACSGLFVEEFCGCLGVHDVGPGLLGGE
jgi:hypothetical protein